ncbi:MAG: UDP-glucose 4-epimerase GalE, partial [Geodermatophilaceae bacterium]|nr:UDP-glucose 4-epimerase GalE [Geodermatophilaceae bacterium]
MKVLVTGGAGYIGSTICSALEDAGHVPVVLDSLYRGPREFTRGRAFYEADVADRDALETIVADHPDLTCTVHCAARIVVPESVRDPYIYWRENVSKSLELCANLLALDKPRVVFSSSASLYALTERFALTEEAALLPTSPYASTKRAVEMLLEDLAAGTDLRAITLRYFNPVGADPKFRSGSYEPIPSHVLGQLVATAEGQVDTFVLTGTDHPTPDGTGIRDYVHVWDLAQAHVAAVERFDDVLGRSGARSDVLNLGTGAGTSVRELLVMFERVLGRPIPVREAPARPGDAVGGYANVDKAARVLGWRSALTVEQGIASALEWR